MGGLIIIKNDFKYSIMGRLKNVFVWTLIFVALSLGLLGFIDDLLKIKHENSRGLNSKLKFFVNLL